jgi:outer membrane protein insertion porin family
LNTRDALGGDTFWATTAEVRFPIPFIPDDLGMSMAVFADAGTLYGAGAGAKKAQGPCILGNTNDVCLADSHSIRASAGVSLLWNSPLGPLRLDVGKPIVKETYDVEQLIRFGASTRF